MEREINFVEPVQRTWKVSAIKPVNFFDNPTYRSRPKKKRPEQGKQEEAKIEDHAQQFKKTGRRIDYSV